MNYFPEIRFRGVGGQFKEGVGIQRRLPKPKIYSQACWKQSKKKKKEMAMMYFFFWREGKKTVRKRKPWPGQWPHRPGRRLVFCSKRKSTSALSGLQGLFLPDTLVKEPDIYKHQFHTWVSTATTRQTSVKARLQFWVIKLHVFPSTFSGNAYK